LEERQTRRCVPQRLRYDDRVVDGSEEYFAFYYTERPHQALGNQAPQEVHKTASGGAAMIVDKYLIKERLPVALSSSGIAA